MGSRVVYELDYRKPVLYVIPIQSILGKLAVVPVGDTGTICGLSTRGHWDGPVICNEWKGVEGTA